MPSSSIEEVDNDDYYNYLRDGDVIVQCKQNTATGRRRHSQHTSPQSIQQKQLEKQQRIDAAARKQNVAYLTVKTYEKMTAKAKKLARTAQKEKADIIRLQRRHFRNAEKRDAELYNEEDITLPPTTQPHNAEVPKC